MYEWWQMVDVDARLILLILLEEMEDATLP